MQEGQDDFEFAFENQANFCNATYFCFDLSLFLQSIGVLKLLYKDILHYFLVYTWNVVIDIIRLNKLRKKIKQPQYT